jgi:hypothetical protein
METLHPSKADHLETALSPEFGESYLKAVVSLVNLGMRNAAAGSVLT